MGWNSKPNGAFFDRVFRLSHKFWTQVTYTMNCYKWKVLVRLIRHVSSHHEALLKDYNGEYYGGVFGEPNLRWFWFFLLLNTYCSSIWIHRKLYYWVHITVISVLGIQKVRTKFFWTTWIVPETGEILNQNFIDWYKTGEKLIFLNGTIGFWIFWKAFEIPFKFQIV